MIITYGRWTYVRRNQAAALFEDRRRLLWRGSGAIICPEVPIEVLLAISIQVENLLKMQLASENKIRDYTRRL